MGARDGLQGGCSYRFLAGCISFPLMMCSCLFFCCIAKFNDFSRHIFPFLRIVFFSGACIVAVVLFSLWPIVTFLLNFPAPMPLTSFLERLGSAFVRGNMCFYVNSPYSFCSLPLFFVNARAFELLCTPGK